MTSSGECPKHGVGGTPLHTVLQATALRSASMQIRICASHTACVSLVNAWARAGAVSCRNLALLHPQELSSQWSMRVRYCKKKASNVLQNHQHSAASGSYCLDTPGAFQRGPPRLVPRNHLRVDGTAAALHPNHSYLPPQISYEV